MRLILSSIILVSQVSKAACILTTQPLMRILRSREAAASVNVKTWPTIIDTGRWRHRHEAEQRLVRFPAVLYLATRGRFRSLFTEQETNETMVKS